MDLSFGGSRIKKQQANTPETKIKELEEPKESKNPKELETLKSETIQDPIATSNIPLRKYIKVILLEFLIVPLKKKAPQKSQLQRFCLITTESDLSRKEENLRRNQKQPTPQKNHLLEIISDQLSVIKKSKVRGKQEMKEKKYPFNQMLVDTFYKGILRYLVQNNFCLLEADSASQMEKYLSQKEFNPQRNVYQRDLQTQFKFASKLSYLLNCNLILFLKIFYEYSIVDYMYFSYNVDSSFKSKFNLFSECRENMLSWSHHVFFQRNFLPFSQPNKQELRIGIVTWNIAGKDLRKGNYIDKLCMKLCRNNSDILVFGFQEIVELKLSFINIRNIVFSCETISMEIKEAIDKIIKVDYHCLSVRNLMGILQLVYIRRNRYSDIKMNLFRSFERKFGGKVGIKMGNKGSVTCMFELKDFGVFSFSNCHLTHGFDKVYKREANLEGIIERTASKDSLYFGNWLEKSKYL